jgi:hypothetical protein
VVFSCLTLAAFGLVLSQTPPKKSDGEKLAWLGGVEIFETVVRAGTVFCRACVFSTAPELIIGVQILHGIYRAFFLHTV